MLNLKKSEWGILIFTLLYIIGFSKYIRFKFLKLKISNEKI
ncbi:MAG: hypothetical protein U5L10_01085 [Candidatus Moranbacteria bacterium]|nr:hypothetical protein [Candidatus Moranbacteria bacterium]